MPENRTAILIFSRNAQEEFRYKSWGLNFRRYSQIHLALLGKIRQTAGATGLPVFEADSSIQQGHDFGTRLLSSINWVKAQGYTQMIIVGNDSPGLNKAALLKARDLLAKGLSVLGRDSHGGAYLMGLNSNHIDEALINGIDWQTNRVFEQLHERLNKVVVLSETLVDLNEKADLQRLAIVDVKVKSIIKLIWALVFGILGRLSVLISAPKPEFTVSFSHRGPPALT